MSKAKPFCLLHGPKKKYLHPINGWRYLPCGGCRSNNLDFQPCPPAIRMQDRPPKRAFDWQQWYENGGREKIIASNRKHRKKNKALRRGAKRGFWFTQRDRARMWNKALGRCFFCGQFTPPDQRTDEHLIPVSRGGVHSIGNIVPACHSCNSSKGRRLLIEWSRRRTWPTLAERAA